MNGSKSCVAEVILRVPQGSVLGPLLFITFINSMVQQVDENGMYLFAHDLKVFTRVNSEDDVLDLQRKIDRLYDWSQYSLLKFYPKKCKVMQIRSTKGKTTVNNYNLSDSKITQVSSIKDLGVTFFEDLSFEEHINEKVNKANTQWRV